MTGTITWKRICCPVDFSETARAGLRVAADLCRRLGSELVLVHARAAAKIASEQPRTGSAEGDLEAMKQEALRLGAPNATVIETGGPPELSIVESAKSADVDLIVMGTHGRSDRAHALAGSVAEAIVRNAPCPVLTVGATWDALSTSAAT